LFASLKNSWIQGASATRIVGCKAGTGSIATFSRHWDHKALLRNGNTLLKGAANTLV